METTEAHARGKLLLSATVDIVCAQLAKGGCDSSKVPAFIAEVHASLSSLVPADPSAAVAAPVKLKPAVSVKASITDDFIICLEDGKRFKSLKRHLGTAYGMTPDEYRQKWGLDPNYPMVAPNDAAARSELAKATGLGRKPAGRATVQ